MEPQWTRPYHVQENLSRLISYTDDWYKGGVREPSTVSGISSAISLFGPPVGGLIGLKVGLDTLGGA